MGVELPCPIFGRYIDWNEKGEGFTTVGTLAIMPSLASAVGAVVGPAGHVAGVLLPALHLVPSVPGTLFASLNIMNMAGARGIGTGGPSLVCKESMG